MQPNQLRFTIITADAEYVLPNSPTGWENTSLKWSRSESYYGMIRNFTAPLDFVLDGAWILRTLFYTFGIRSEAQLKVEVLNPATWGYEIAEQGDFDFSTFKDNKDTVTINLMDNSISAFVKAYENVDYTIQIDVDDAIDIELTPLKLREKATFIFMPTDGRFNKSILGLNLIINEVQAIGDPSSITVDFFNVNENPPVPLDSDWDNRFFYRAKIDTEITIAGNIKGSFRGGTGNNSFTVSVYKYSNGVGEYLQEIVSEVINGENTINFDQDFSDTFPLLEGDILYFITTQFPVGSGGDVTNAGTIITEGELNLTYFTGSAASFCKALRPKYVFEQLLKKMNQGAVVPYQSYLLDEWDQLVITSGQAIKQIDNPVLITSFNKFFQSINSVLNAGFGVENGKAVLEKKSYFFKNIQGFDLGENKEFSLELYDNYIYNSIKIGYPDSKFATIVNDLDEVNSTQQYSLPIKRVQRELSLISAIRGDAYGIEDTRITPIDASNTNNNNDAFFIYINADPEGVSGEPYYRPERDEGYISLSGVLAAETYYNWRISPKQNILRHGDYIRSMSYNYEGFSLNFESALKNSLMSVTENSGRVVKENANVAITTLDSPIFIPYLISFTTKTPANVMNLIDQFPTGYLATQFSGNNLTGFIIEVSADIARNSQRDYKLLLSKDNLLLNLIR